jgi:membrane protein YqaA with SNARE-associated domain
MKKFSPSSIIAYNKNEKKKFLLTFFYIFIFLLIFGLSYYFYFKNLDFFLIKFLNFAVDGVSFEIKNLSYQGIFYIALLGGFFLIFMPLEVIFISVLTGGKSAFILIPVYLLGIFISYNFNYYIGYKLGDFSKKLITYKKFYSIKKLIDNHGILAIFLFNFLPLPSQPLSTILGVFKYNLFRFYIFFILGQLLKYILIAVTYLYIF